MSLSTDIIDKIAALLTAAFGMVAALAWNETIKKIFEVYFPQADAIIPMVFYAVAVTVVAVLITIWVGYLSAKAKVVSEKVSNKVSETTNHVVQKIKKN